MKFNQLTARQVATIRQPGWYADGGNLYLQVSPAKGDRVTKSWLLRFMIDGCARKMGLGPTHTISLAEAREEARRLRQLLIQKIDPIEARLAERDAHRKSEAERITFKQATAKYLAVHEPTWRNEKHRQQWRATLEKHAFPTLGSRPMSAIDAALINQTLAPIWSKTPETASRTKQRIERVVAWVRDGMPLPTVGKSKRVRHHKAMPYEELPAFMERLRSMDSISARALEFTILTGARTGETIGAVWDEIDLDAKVWSIPGERMKGHKDHRVPLSDRVINILKNLPAEKNNPFVFIGATPGNGLSNMAMLECLKGMAGNGYTTHGFRSAFKNWSAERTNYPNIVSEAALAHTVSDKVEKAYRRGDLFEKRRRLMRDWARFSAAPVTRPAEVVPLKRRA